jgi:hypothetical protein
MSALKISYQNVTDKAQAYELAKTQVPQALAKFGVSADVQHRDQDFSLTAKGKGFDVSLKFLETEALLELELGFLLKPLRGKILEVLERQIKKVV